MTRRTNSHPRRPARLAATIAAAAALAAPASALALPALDGYYDSGGQPARWYALFWNGAFVSEVHAKGCATEVPAGQQLVGSVYKATRTGAAKAEPCVVQVGLNASAAFRSAVASALNGTVAAKSVAIVEVAGGTAVSEVAGMAYISDVTLASAPSGDSTGYIAVELVPSSGLFSKTSAARTLGAPGIDSIDLTKTSLNLDGQSFGAGTTVKPLAFERADSGSGGGTTSPGPLALAAPTLRVPPASPLSSTVDSWFAAAVSGPVTYKQIAATFVSAGGRSLSVKLESFPVRWDPYASGGGRLLKLAAGATPLEIG